MDKFKVGQRVYIEGHLTILRYSLGAETPGGWRVNPFVEDCQWWNEDAMTPETEKQELIRMLYECDSASALCNRAARFIEKMNEGKEET